MGTNQNLDQTYLQYTLVLGSLVLLCFYILSVIQKAKNLPPGPWGVPILGTLPLLGKKPYLTMQKWWRKHGDIYSMYMGSRLCVVLNGTETMKECLVKQGDDFCGRPWNYFRKIMKNTGLVFTDGPVWQEHRKFTISCLRDLGMGKTKLETKINEEARYLLEAFESKNSQPFEIGHSVYKAVSNVICLNMYGFRFEYDDPVFQAYIDALEQSARHHSLIGMVNFMPFLEFILKLLPTDYLLKKNYDLRDNFAAEQIHQHKETLDEDNPRDMIDLYLIRMNALKKSNTVTTFEEKHLKRTVQDVFIGGSETMNTTMMWMLLFMAMHPDVQQKVQEEINQVIGCGRRPTMADRKNMSYTKATIMECQRLGNISLISIPRCTLNDTKVMGYDIPKGTWCFINRWGVHASARYWRNPYVFNPDRFLDGQDVVKPEGFIPYGMGPRNCPGQIYAKMELFLFFTNIFQSFDIRLPDDGPSPSLEPICGLNMAPRPFKIIASPR